MKLNPPFYFSIPSYLVNFKQQNIDRNLRKHRGPLSAHLRNIWKANETEIRRNAPWLIPEWEKRLPLRRLFRRHRRPAKASRRRTSKQINCYNRKNWVSGIVWPGRRRWCVDVVSETGNNNKTMDIFPVVPVSKVKGGLVDLYRSVVFLMFPLNWFIV